MEEDRELKHSCKFCNKSFPCGRSLGGHMRSHMINNNSSETTNGYKFAKKKKKLPSLNNGESAACYSLRENPKKTRRLVDTSDDTSSKTLFGSMEKERVSNNNNTILEDQDSWTNSTQKLIMDSQSDNETAAPNRKRRSKRRTRYMITTANSSSLSVADNNNNGSSSVSEIEQEQQEEVAMCLMMLSRDMGPRVCFNSVVESSDNNSVLLEAKVDGGGILKLKENCQFDETVNKNNSSKKKLCDSFDPSDTEFLKESQKRSKFECTTCNKIFHSYQALGGHRASHKKIKGCFASKIDSNEISYETQLSPDTTADNKHNSMDHLVVDCADDVPKKRHECPICLKVFSSGQALGGHKRSHIVNEGRSNSSIVIGKPPMPEIRNFLDLNLPAPADEESNTDQFKPWWIDMWV
ncbi:hypothetical protein LWI29_010401 [Acer saccharum]|uniref:C2H2-type domain-containing protein n=1 Tax=Acer saccharum TaxID=4024 RepID=A0AA39VPD6_ACESA|nr:hypothetical protein LWI29_010401 [Acer saccharum]KAK1565080.1 hypothetical protein Q3G72_018267 [Acer saccharum]